MFDRVRISPFGSFNSGLDAYLNKECYHRLGPDYWVHRNLRLVYRRYAWAVPIYQVVLTGRIIHIPVNQEGIVWPT